MILGAPLFDLRGDFMVLVTTYCLLRPWFKTSCNFNPKKKGVSLGATLFGLGVDFKDLVATIPVAKAMVSKKL
jgi:hypothetical protein